jgi:hypothetical protein
LYRTEEWFKVFIHESIHYYGLDFSSAPPARHRDADAQIRRQFGLDRETIVRCNEAYCECIARAWYVALCVYMRAPSAFAAQFAPAWRRELAFSVSQAERVLAHSRADRPQGRHIRSNSACFAYYVLSCILMHHAHELVEWREDVSDERWRRVGQLCASHRYDLFADAPMPREGSTLRMTAADVMIYT